MPYVLWCIAFNATFLLAFKTMEETFIQGSERPPFLLDKINRHSLMIFLVVCNSLLRHSPMYSLALSILRSIQCTPRLPSLWSFLSLICYLCVVCAPDSWTSTCPTRNSLVISFAFHDHVMDAQAGLGPKCACAMDSQSCLQCAH